MEIIISNWHISNVVPTKMRVLLLFQIANPLKSQNLVYEIEIQTQF